ncbi:MAG TPA: hypothetical protein ENI94_15125, partial [Gammaproteobacteria bacterium]|nr:hypothetical protein [Gammaproteobacteria bacterium]
TKLLDSHSWSTVKLDLYGLKFFYQHVLKKPWMKVDLIKPPKATRLRDIGPERERKRKGSKRKGSGMLREKGVVREKGVGYVESFSKCGIKGRRQKFVACYLRKRSLDKTFRVF